MTCIRREPIEEWTSIYPTRNQGFPAISGTIKFTVLLRAGSPQTPRKLFFVANELFRDALGLRNHYKSLAMVEEQDKVTKKVETGCRPQVCVSERGVQQMLNRVRNTNPQKLALVVYLNTNYDVHFISRMRGEDEPPCEFCALYDDKLERLEEKNRLLVLACQRLKRQLDATRSELSRQKMAHHSLYLPQKRQRSPPSPPLLYSGEEEEELDLVDIV